MKKLFFKMLDIILPPRCLCCGDVVNTPFTLCKDCFSKINFIGNNFCYCCGEPLGYYNNNKQFCVNCMDNNKKIFRMVRSAVYYDEASKPLILDFKFFDHTENKILLANWLYLAGYDILGDVDLIIPVPLHIRRLFKRKYNQSAMLAIELSKKTRIDADFSSLKKKRHTTPQVECNARTRKQNVRNAFYVSDIEAIKGKRIVLIDDVYTTGSTLKECAKVLKKAGAKSVDALTVARVYS